MWTTENRARYNRDPLRYPSDVTEEEWTEIAPLIPPARRGGRKRTVNIRAVLKGLMYVLSTGCQWRSIPKDLPPRSTIFHYFGVWEADGTPEADSCRPVCEVSGTKGPDRQPDRLYHRQPEREKC